MGILTENYPRNNILTNQLISATNKLIDSARQVEECENIKLISIFFLGEQSVILEQKYPEMYFATVQPPFVDITPIFSIRQLPPKSCHLITFL